MSKTPILKVLARVSFYWQPMTICGKNVDTLRPCKRSNRDFFWLWSTENTHIPSSPVFLYITRGVLRFAPSGAKNPAGAISHAYTNSWQHLGHEKLPWHFVMLIFQFIRRKYYFIFNFNRLIHFTVTSVSSTGCLKCLRKGNSWIPLLNRVVMRCILPLGVWCACSPRQKSR